MLKLNKLKLDFVHIIPNKLLKRSPDFVEKYFLAELLIVENDNKISRLPIWCYISKPHCTFL